LNVNIPANLLMTLQSCRTLPSVPAVAIQVLNLSQDPEIGTAKIAQAIARDPALTARILKVANSAWCGVRHNVTTLNQAVNLLGLNGTMSLALSFSMVRGLKTVGGPAFDHLTYWRRSAIAANAAVSVGAGQTIVNQGELFLAGLLQDIGMMILAEALPTYGRLAVTAANDHNALVEIELKELGADHAQVGSWFLDKWKLPESLVKAVNTSHEKENIEGLLAKSVAIGGKVAEIWVNPNAIAATEFAADSAKKLMGFSSEHFEQVLTATAADLAEVTANLDIPVGDEAFINKLLDQAREALSEINVRALQEVRSLSVQVHRDALTMLYNRTYLDQILEEQFHKSKAVGQPLTLIFIDIDNFKHINDSYGHNGGDGVLVSVSQAIHSAVRSSDTIARFGGDEFVVLFNNTGENAGAMLAERIRSTVAKQLHYAGEGICIHVTISIGVTTMLPGSKLRSAKELLEVADRHLYAAKLAGRNRVAQAS
jgi:diguanylate cyclase (GGDEF)-like protein